jgi:hypothetical protein
MGKRYFAQVRKHFRFLVDEHGFAVEREVDEGRYAMVVIQYLTPEAEALARVEVERQT